MKNKVATAVFSVILIVMVVNTVASVGLIPTVFATPVSDSMEPTVSQSDIVIITPDDTVQQNDVILYDSPDHEQGVLHRVVSVEPDGFVTKGDANDITDQEDGADLVTQNDITGTAATFNGDVLVIPHLGIFLSSPLVMIMFWLVVASFSAIFALTKNTRGKSVDKKSKRTGILLVGIGVIVIISLASLGTAATVSTGITTTETASNDAPHIVQPGEVGEYFIDVQTPAFIGVHHSATVSNEELTIDRVEGSSWGELTIVVTNTPSESTGLQSGDVSVYTYPATLPAPVIDSLERIHPAVAAITTSSIIGVAFIFLSWLLIDPKKPVRESRTIIRKTRNENV